ncbi:MAG: GFA family protein [Micropepsaceae bacterium]
MTVTATCHCGAVSIETASAPETLTNCNCSLCRRTGALWAYYPPSAVRVAHPHDGLDGYIQGDRSLTTWRCRTCGCITHWTAVDPAYERMAVNARLMPPEIVRAARVRNFDGADTWTFLDE